MNLTRHGSTVDIQNMLHALHCTLSHFLGLGRVCRLPAAGGGGGKLSHYLCIGIIAIHVCAWNGAPSE